ncbi:MAG: alkaline phosphatase family protein [Armatimonadetes bacterium]|nr:alkaline phosphatase family protein [Armatimonadota bacterium]
MTAKQQPRTIAALLLLIITATVAGSGHTSSRSVAPQVPSRPSARAPSPKIILLSWDGTPAWMVNKLLSEGKLPNLARLKQQGLQAEYSVSNFPDPSTPCGHATLWTGAPSAVHGITSFFMPALPAGDHTVLEKQSGFNSYLLKAEPLWIPFLRAGKRVTLVHTPQQYPFTAYTSDKRFGGNFQDRLVVLDGFGANKVQSNRPEVAKNYLERVGEFIGKDGKLAYQQGLFGKPITEGGEGSAEKEYLITVEKVASHFRRATLFGMRYTDWDLLICYTPFPDSAGHVWDGLLDPSSPAFNPVWAERIWPYMEQVMELCDLHLGTILFNAPRNCVVTLVSDHGMMGIAKKFHINTILRNAGLIAVEGAGRVDLSKTKILYPPGGSSFLRLNWAKYREGIVKPEDRAQIVRKTVEVLLAAKDPQTGDQIVTGVLDSELVGPSLGFGDERTGDLMITLAEGYDFDDDVNKEEVVERQSPLHSGAHRFYPDHPSCRTIFFITGPGIPRGRVIPPVRHTDIAPTLCELGGVAAPAQAIGKPIPGVFR